jgi:predicted ATPase/transcriptional regulator with XRE-family HTH domain
MLAERAGVSVATIGALEEGLRRRPHPHTLAALADALGLSSDERARLLESASSSPASTAAREPPTNPATRLAPAEAWSGDQDLAAPTTASPGPPSARPRLPVPPTALIGREAELAAATAQLDPARSSVRLLTLTGPGGVGKTRLGLAVAAALADAYADGVFFVDLAPLHDARLVAATIARVLQVPGSGGRSARELLLEYLRDRQVLVILDNFEHLLEAASLMAELLATCSRLAMLVTSRTALRLRSEQRFVVGPLITPPDDALSVEATRAAPAVQLFVERTRAISPDFALDANNARAVGAICRRLEGIPLAIELVAARAELLGPQALLRRLERGMPLQMSGPPDLPERQRTLQHTLAWSHELLEVAEQTVFRRLAVFAGGWTLEAAEAVCSDSTVTEDDVLDVLGRLVDKSLVEINRADPSSRYRLLEIVRDYAIERLQESGELEALRARHLNWCVTMAEHAEAALDNPDAALWFNQLDSELDNLRMALEWSETSGHTETGLRLAGALRWFWDLRGHAREGRGHLARLLNQAAPDYPTETYVKALNAAGYLAVYQDDHAAARTYCEKAAELAGELNAAHERAYALRMLALVAWREGDLEAAAKQFTYALAAYQAIGDQQSFARASISVANISWMQGLREQAIAGYQDSLVLARASGLKHETAMALQGLGHAALVEGDRARAGDILRECLQMFKELGDKPCGSATLELCACLAAAEGRSADAARWFGIAETTREAMGRGFSLATFRSAYDQGIAIARAALGDDAFLAAWAFGRTMSLDEALTQAAAVPG